MNTDSKINKYILSGINFSDNGPQLVLDAVPPKKTERIRFSVWDKNFTLIRYKRRFCIGRYSLDTFEDWPCPFQSTVDINNRECPACINFNGFVPAFYRLSPTSLSSQQRRYNERPHVVYLAHFGGDKIKVGIANTQRVRIRLMEQGARVAQIIAYCDSAYQARSIEAKVSEKEGISEVVHIRTKRRLLGTIFDSNTAIAQLHELNELLAQELSLQTIYESIDLTYQYLGNRSLELSAVDLTDEHPFSIGGIGVGIIGSVLVVETDKGQYIASLSKALGHVVSLSDQLEPNSQLRDHYQFSLF
jgi:hypothetical protein